MLQRKTKKGIIIITDNGSYFEGMRDDLNKLPFIFIFTCLLCLKFNEIFDVFWEYSFGRAIFEQTLS